MLLIVFVLLVFALIPASVCFRIAEWCLRRRLWVLVCLALAVLGAGTVYGLLRLTGAVILPDDHAWSMDFFDASWRDDGVRLLMLSPFAGATAAALPARNRKRRSSASGTEREL